MQWLFKNKEPVRLPFFAAAWQLAAAAALPQKWQLNMPKLSLEQTWSRKKKWTYVSINHSIVLYKKKFLICSVVEMIYSARVTMEELNGFTSPSQNKISGATVSEIPVGLSLLVWREPVGINHLYQFMTFEGVFLTSLLIHGVWENFSA